MYSFTIKIVQVDGNKAYAINFDSREAIEYIQRNYKKYDEVLGNLEYDESSDLVKFRIQKKDLDCVSFFMYINMHIYIYRNM